MRGFPSSPSVAVDRNVSGQAARLSYYPVLDVFRAFAAFLVVLEHTRNYLWLDYQADQARSAAIKLIYFISGLGHEAVMLFFVLSGCVVGRIVIERYERGTWSWPDFLYDRLTRLWLVLIPAVALTWLCDFLSLRVAGSDSFVHAGGFAHIQDAPLAERISPRIILGNILFLQQILVPTLGSNGPLWSLANEFWYYMAFPLLVGGFYARRPIVRLVAPVIGVAILYCVGSAIAEGFIIWLLGAGAYFWGRRLQWTQGTLRVVLEIGVVATLAALALARMRWPGGRIILDVNTSILGAAFAVVTLASIRFAPNGWWLELGRFFSKFSYSLYLVHLPVLTLLVAPFLRNNASRMPAGWLGLVTLVSVVAVLYTIAYGFYWLTERNTPAVRGWISRQIQAGARGSGVLR